MNDGTIVATMSPDEAAMISAAVDSAVTRGFSTATVERQAGEASRILYAAASGWTPEQAVRLNRETLEDATIWRNRAQEAEASLLTAQDDLEVVISGERPNGTEPMVPEPWLRCIICKVRQRKVDSDFCGECRSC